MATDRYTPATLGPPRILFERLAGGYQGTQRTVENIQQLIRSGARDFYVRQHAIDVLMARGIAAKDYLGEIRALFEWVQGNIRYTKDPFRVEVLHSARRMLQLRAGDCDDMTILLGSMLEAVGHPVRLVLVGPDPRQPHLFSHIYLEAYHNGHWLPLDPTMPYAMGWAPGAWTKQVVTIERRPAVMDATGTLRGTPTASQNRVALEGLIRGVRSEGLPAKDARVRAVWELLRRRRLLDRSPWLKALLRATWRRGLPPRLRPRTTRRLLWLLARWQVIPALGPPRRPASSMRRGPSVGPWPRDHRLAPASRGTGRPRPAQQGGTRVRSRSR
jgi:hypothetical protein